MGRYKYIGVILDDWNEKKKVDHTKNNNDINTNSNNNKMVQSNEMNFQALFFQIKNKIKNP